MFSSVADSLQDLSGPVLFPVRFSWPYGGSRVLLTGTFTRWSEHIPMSPLEDCSSVFQVVCHLTPGFHQYKFCVDGEWRHDENQRCVTGNYGIVNTLFVGRDSEPIQAMHSPGTPGSRMNMDVDNDHSRRLVAMSGGAMQEVAMRISQADIEMSRHRISEYLSCNNAYELLPESGKVIALDVSLPVKQAFHILYEQSYYKDVGMVFRYPLSLVWRSSEHSAIMFLEQGYVLREPARSWSKDMYYDGWRRLVCFFTT